METKQAEYEWAGRARCSTCFKMTATVLGVFMNLTAPGWCNLHTREEATRLAREGVCPWCGKRTTTPARTLLARHEPTLMEHARAGWRV